MEKQLTRIKEFLSAKNTIIATIVWGIITLFIILFFSGYSPLSEGMNCMTGDYLDFAKSMVSGKVLYTDLYDHKGLFLFIPYIFAYFIDRTGTDGVYVLDVIAGMLFAVAAYRFSRIYCSKTKASLLTLFSVVLIRMFFLTSLYANTDFLAGVIFLILCRYIESGDFKSYSLKYYSFIGLLFAMLLWSKYVMVLAIFPAWLYIFIYSIKQKEFTKFFKGNLVAFATICGFSVPMLGYFIYHGNVKDMFNTYIFSTGDMSVSLIPSAIIMSPSTIITILVAVVVLVFFLFSKKDINSYIWLASGILFVYVFCVIRNIINLYTVCIIAPLFIIFLSKIKSWIPTTAIAIVLSILFLPNVLVGSDNPVKAEIIAASEYLGEEVADCYYMDEDMGLGMYVDTCPITKKYQWWPAGISYDNDTKMWETRKGYLENQTMKYVVLSLRVNSDRDKYTQEQYELIYKNYSLVKEYDAIAIYQSNITINGQTKEN